MADTISTGLTGKEFDIECRRRELLLSAGLFFAGLIALLRGKSAFALFWIPAAIFFAAGMLAPRMPAPVIGLIDKAVSSLLRLCSAAMFTLFYFAILTPWALALRLFAKPGDQERESYWIRKSESRDGKERYERQY